MKDQTKEIATTQNAISTAVSFEMAMEDVVEGSQELTREDLQIPMVVLVQAQSKNVPEPLKHGGMFYNNLTGEFSESIDAILLSQGKARVCFDRKYDGDSEPLCGSDDSISPRAEYIGKQITDTEQFFDHTINSDGCASCPLSKFSELGTPPMCAKSYSYAMLDAQSGLPFIMRASRTATQAAKQLNTIAKTMGRRKYIHITSKGVESDKGNYFVPAFTVSSEVEQGIKQYAFKFSLDSGNIAQRAPLSESVKLVSATTQEQEPA